MHVRKTVCICERAARTIGAGGESARVRVRERVEWEGVYC